MFEDYDFDDYGYEPVDGLFGDRHSSVSIQCFDSENKREFDKDKYNRDGNPKGWHKTEEMW